MNRFLIRYITMILLLLIAISHVDAQNYPVDINVVVLPPHAPAYHTFSQSSMMQSNKMQVTMTLKDLVVDQLDIGLQVEFRGESGSFISDPALISQSFTLNKGMPKIIQNQDLAPYFLSNGLSEAVVSNGGFLPEGQWEICVTAFELLNQEQVSRQTCYYMFLEELDPPEIILPLDSMLPTYPQNIQLTWQPLHIGSFPVRYTVNVWEVLEGFTDQQIVESTQPYISKSFKQQTTDWLSVADPPMIVGQEYIMQVLIEDDVNGIMGPQVYAFKNNGFSEIHRFKYGMQVAGEECETPSTPEYMIDDSLRYFVYWDDGEPPAYEYNATSTFGDAATMDVSSSSVLGGTEIPGKGNQGGGGGSSSSTSSSSSSGFAGYYKMYYRVEGTEEWFNIETREAWAEFDDFKRGNNYEVYVSKVCSAEERGSESIIIKFPTLPPERDFTCGMPPLEIDLTNQAPLMHLAENDTILAGSFRVVITQVNGSNGRYSGEGYFKMSMFNAKIGVEFSDIFVNDEYRMVDGFIETQYDPTGTNIFNTNEVTDLFSSPDEPFPVIYLPSFENAEFANGQVTVYPGGATYDSPLRVQTPEGDILLTGGMILKEIEFDRPKEISDDYQIEFTASSEQLYGFDEVDELIQSEYKTLGSTFLPHKSVAYGGADEVLLKITAAKGGWKAENWDSIRIITHNKFEVEFTKPLGDTRDLVLRLPGMESEELIYVMYNEECMGAINLAPYKLTNYTVNLVSVNGAGSSLEVSALESQINEILKQGVVQVTMNKLEGEGISDEDPDGEITADTEVLTAYSDDMKRIMQKHLNEYGQEENQMYFFLVDNLEGYVVGFMADGQTAGFVDVGTDNVAHTIAHELGHGAYTLDHFWNVYGAVYPEGSSDNLMDYGGGDDLVYKQWNRMHNQGFPTPWFKGGEEQAYREALVYKCLDFAHYGNVTNGYYKDLRGRVVQLDDDYIPYSFVGVSSEEEDIRGALAIIYQISTDKYYYPAKDDEKYPHYYFRKAPGKLDANDILNLKEYPEQEATLINIESDCEFQVLRSGNILKEDKTNSCNCFDVIAQDGDGKAQVIDFTSTVSEEAIRKAIDALNKTQDSTGVDVSLFIIDHNTNDSIRSLIQDRIDKLTGDSYIVRLEFENETDYKPIDIYYGISYDSRTFNEFLNEAIADSKLATKFSLDLLTDFLDGLAHIVKNLAVPERFYNPEHKNYKPYLAKIYEVSSYLNPTSYANNVILNELPNKGDYKSYQIEFAFTVGIYNGLINQVGDLVELPSLLIKLVTNEDGLRDTMLLSFEQFSKDCEEADKNLGGCALEKIWSLIVKAHGGSNSCLLAHQVGKDVSELATFFLAFAKIGKLGKLGKASQLMEKLDATTYIIKGGGALLKFSVAAGKTTFRFGKSTLVLVATISETGAVTGWKILKEIGGEVEQIINKGLDEFLPSTNLATVQINNRIYLGASDVKDWKVNELLSDAQTQLQDDFGNYLVELKKIGNDGLEESKLIIAKVIELDEFYKFLKEKEGDLDFVNYLSSLDKKTKQSLNVDLKDPKFRGWLKDVDGVNSWDDLTKAGKTFSNTNPVVLEKYLKLSEKNKVLVLKFSDNADNSTLSKFLDDTDDPDFLAFINKAENENFVKSFVSHKKEVNLSNITDYVAEKVLNDLKGLPGETGVKARKWNSRSAKIAGNNSIFAKASKFEVEDPEIPGSGIARRKFLDANDLDDLQSVNQVTIEVDGTKIRLDYLGRDGDELFHLGDAKFSTKNKNWSSEWTSAATPNQKIVIPKIIAGKDITIRATNPNKIKAIENNLGIKLTNGQFTIKPEEIGSLKIIGSEADDFTKIKQTVDLLN